MIVEHSIQILINRLAIEKMLDRGETPDLSFMAANLLAWVDYVPTISPDERPAGMPPGLRHLPLLFPQLGKLRSTHHLHLPPTGFGATEHQLRRRLGLATGNEDLDCHIDAAMLSLFGTSVPDYAQALEQIGNKTPEARIAMLANDMKRAREHFPSLVGPAGRPPELMCGQLHPLQICSVFASFARLFATTFDMLALGGSHDGKDLCRRHLSQAMRERTEIDDLDVGVNFALQHHPYSSAAMTAVAHELPLARANVALGVANARLREIASRNDREPQGLYPDQPEFGIEAMRSQSNGADPLIYFWGRPVLDNLKSGLRQISEGAAMFRKKYARGAGERRQWDASGKPLAELTEGQAVKIIELCWTRSPALIASGLADAAFEDAIQEVLDAPQAGRRAGRIGQNAAKLQRQAGKMGSSAQFHPVDPWSRSPDDARHYDHLVGALSRHMPAARSNIALAADSNLAVRAAQLYASMLSPFATDYLHRLKISPRVQKIRAAQHSRAARA